MIELLHEIAARGETVSYSEFGRMLRKPLHHRNPALYELLRDICYDEREAGRPNLCALVVRKADGIPGKGFFEYAGFHGEDVGDPLDYWRSAVEACWEFYQDKDKGSCES